jgi:hypothetical protein
VKLRDRAYHSLPDEIAFKSDRRDSTSADLQHDAIFRLAVYVADASRWLWQDVAESDRMQSILLVTGQVRESPFVSRINKQINCKGRSVIAFHILGCWCVRDVGTTNYEPSRNGQHKA